MVARNEVKLTENKGRMGIWHEADVARGQTRKPMVILGIEESINTNILFSRTPSHYYYIILLYMCLKYHISLIRFVFYIFQFFQIKTFVYHATAHVLRVKFASVFYSRINLKGMN